jgi:hypothetical protein
MWWEPIVGIIGVAACCCVIPIAFYEFRKFLRLLKDIYG